MRFLCITPLGNLNDYRLHSHKCKCTLKIFTTFWDLARLLRKMDTINFILELHDYVLNKSKLKVLHLSKDAIVVFNVS